MNNSLTHHGILGMKWGVRRYQNPDGTLTAEGKKRYGTNSIEEFVNVPDGVHIRSDGSMSIPKGTNIQRLVGDTSRPLKDITYASILDYDNSTYIKMFGGKGLFGGDHDRILSIQTVEDLRSPSVREAQKIMVDMIRENPDFQGIYRYRLGGLLSDKQLKQMFEDPYGKVAHDVYIDLNTSLAYDESFDKNATMYREMFSKSLLKNGYNCLRDETDYQFGFSIAPLVILQPEKTLKVVSVNQITDDLKRASAEKLKAYRSLGMDWIEQYVYK